MYDLEDHYSLPRLNKVVASKAVSQEDACQMLSAFLTEEQNSDSAALEIHGTPWSDVHTIYQAMDSRGKHQDDVRRLRYMPTVKQEEGNGISAEDSNVDIAVKAESKVGNFKHDDDDEDEEVETDRFWSQGTPSSSIVLKTDPTIKTEEVEDVPTKGSKKNHKEEKKEKKKKSVKKAKKTRKRKREKK